jgi:outer membrane protein assembly factor BamB
MGEDGGVSADDPSPAGEAAAAPVAAPVAPSPPAPPVDPSQAALDRYRARLRPWRLGYAAVITVAVVVAAVIVRVAYTHGEISHVTLHTVAHAPPTVALQAAAATQTQAWSSTDATAINDPIWNGTIVTFDQHTVRGRNAATGTPTWSYTRSDRTVCTAMQTDGVTIAVFRLAGNCDEVTALNSGTGVREWTRTLDENGHPINGTPSYDAQSDVFMVYDSAVIYAIDPGSGEDRWMFAEQGCTMTGAAFGTTGALISQNCSHRDCSGVKFCRQGSQLVLRDLYSGQNTNTDTNHGNPDQLKWNIPVNSAERPASADRMLSALGPGGQLQVLNSTSGKVQLRIALGASVQPPVTAVTANQSELLWIGGTTFAFTPAPSLLWKSATPGPPTVTTAPKFGQPDLSTAVVAAPGPSGVVVLDGDNGAAKHTYPVSAPPAGSQVYPLGTGFLVTGSSTVVYR